MSDHRIIEDGRVLADRALAVPVETASSLAASRFNPSRVMQDFYLSRYYEPKAGRPADNVQAAIEYVHDLYLRPAQDEADRLAGLAHWAAHKVPPVWKRFILSRLPASAMSAREGQDPQGLEAKPAGPVPQADAQPLSTPSNGEPA